MRPIRFLKVVAILATVLFAFVPLARATTLLNVVITTAVVSAVSPVYQFADGVPKNLAIQGNFTYGSSGTSADAYVQTSFDGGATWVDIANYHFTTSSLRKLVNLSSLTPVTTQVTPTDGSLTANTVIDGLIGSQLRVKYVTVGTYAGSTTLVVSVSTARLAASSAVSP